MVEILTIIAMKRIKVEKSLELTTRTMLELGTGGALSIASRPESASLEMRSRGSYSYHLIIFLVIALFISLGYLNLKIIIKWLKFPKIIKRSPKKIQIT